MNAPAIEIWRARKRSAVSTHVLCAYVLHQVDVCWADKRVIVTFDRAKASTDAIARAITAAGFWAEVEV
jgi:hypothetical protein